LHHTRKMLHLKEKERETTPSTHLKLHLDEFLGYHFHRLPRPLSTLTGAGSNHGGDFSEPPPHIFHTELHDPLFYELVFGQDLAVLAQRDERVDELFAGEGREEIRRDEQGRGREGAVGE
jgi:hypothetical protein